MTLDEYLARERTNDGALKVAASPQDVPARLEEQYRKEHGNKAPKGAVKDLINLADHALMDSREIALNRDADSRIRELQSEVAQANKVLADLKAAHAENEELLGPRAAAVLSFYKQVINLPFETWEERKANIRNASYVVWAAFATGEHSDIMDISGLAGAMKEEREPQVQAVEKTNGGKR